MTRLILERFAQSPHTVPTTDEPRHEPEIALARSQMVATLGDPGFRGRSVADYSIAHSSIYGVPIVLDLSHFQSGTCKQIAIGEFQIQFHFHPSGTISVEGRSELRDPGGQIIDRSMEPPDRDSCKLHRIVGKSEDTTFLKAPDSFGLIFDNGYTLEIFDDSQQFEKCQSSPAGVII